MFFSGNTKRKNINLGGRSATKKEDRDRFLQRTERERAQRLLEKRRQASALKIQSFWRAKKELERRRREECEDWQSRLQRLLMLPPQLSTAAPIFFPLLRQFLFFYRENVPSDRPHLWTVCSLVLKSLNNAGPANFCALAFAEATETRGGWLLLVRRLACILVNHLLEGPPSGDQLSMPLNILAALTSPAAYSFVNNISYDQKGQVCAQILNALVNNELYRNITNALKTQISLLSSNKEQRLSTSETKAKEAMLFVQLMQLALAPFKNSFFISAEERTSRRATKTTTTMPAPQRARKDFVRYVLSIPDLSSAFKAASASAEETELIQVFPDCLDTSALMHDGGDAERRTLEESIVLCRCVLLNLLDLGPSVIRLGAEPVMTKYLAAINQLMNHLSSAFRLANRTQKRIDEYGEFEGEAEEAESNMLVAQSAISNTLKEEEILDHVQFLLDPDLLRSLIKLYLDEETQESQKDKGKDTEEDHRRPSTLFLPFNKLFPEGLQVLCRLCNTLQRDHPSLRMPLLNTLSFSSHSTFVTKLWHRLTCSQQLDQLATFGFVEDMDGSLEQMVPALSLFCACYNHLLVTMDDEEFFERETHFRLTEVTEMVGMLKRIVFRMYWSKGGEDPALLKVYQDSFLRKSITAVLRQLYDRNSRRRFCMDEHWNVEEIGRQTETFKTDVAREDKRALRILKHIPFVVPTDLRVELFHQLVRDMKNRIDPLDTRITVRRDYVLEDGFDALHYLPPEAFRGIIRVSFISTEGLPEAGIDGGGVFKEFLTELTKTAFSSSYGLFKETADHLLYPNPHSELVASDHMQQLEFLGRVLGKALYESILVDVPFANFFLAKLLRKHNYFNDLVFLDPQLHKNLMVLKHYPGDVEQDFSLNFTITDDEFGRLTERELIPGGKDIPVTNENRIKYIYLVANYRLNIQISRQCTAFLKGFADIIPPEWLRMFNQHELHLLIAGREGGIDLVDLREHTAYGPGYHDQHPTIEMFWSVVQSFTPKEQRQLLKFVTSSSRPPLLGFRYLNPPFCIHKRHGDKQSLPTASTCMNLLKLGSYETPEKMREKLLYAIAHSTGFELS
ncbi:HECT-type E3 ubiquitin transferase [Balamuthia mandrillaris]